MARHAPKSAPSRPSSTSRTGLTLPAVLAAILGTGALLGGIGWLASAPADAATARAWEVQLAPDTVLVWGPRRFEVARGEVALHVEEFTVAPRWGSRYYVEISNGTEAGSLRAERGRLVLNDTELLSDDTRLAGGRTVLEDLTLEELNALTLELSGQEGAVVEVRVYEIGLEVTTIFGPVEVVRTKDGESNTTTTTKKGSTTKKGTATKKGGPVEEEWIFDLPGGVEAPFTLVVENGYPDGSNEASAAWLIVNGVEVFGPDAFGKGKGKGKGQDGDGPLEADIDLQETGNTFRIRLDGGEDSRIAAWITAILADVTPPVVTITAPEPQRVTSEPEVLVQGAIDDETETTVTVNGVEAEVLEDATFTALVPLPEEGPTEIAVLATDAAGNEGTATVTVVRDVTAPALDWADPADELVTNVTPTPLTGTATDDNGVELALDGVPVATDETTGAFDATVELAEGPNLLTLVATDPAGNQTVEARSVFLDAGAPTLSVTAPEDGLLTDQPILTVSGTVADATDVTVEANGTALTVDGAGAFSGELTLTEGDNDITVTATDEAGNQETDTRTVTLDQTPPVLEVDAPENDRVTNQATVTVTGTVTDASDVTVEAGGTPLPVDGAGVFSGEVPLNPGLNFLTVTATDAVGNSALTGLVVTSDPEAPDLVVSAPSDGLVTEDATVTVSGTVTDLTAVTLTVDGAPVPVDGSGAFTATASLNEGPNSVTVVATDAAGNASTESRSVTRETGDPTQLRATLPVDPAFNAPPLNPNLPTTTFGATEFLYTGANPLQTGVPTGTITVERASAVRGRVLDRAGQPVAGVEIEVLGRPEYGRTQTLASGQFQMAVNGGERLTLSMSKPGYLPVQRPVTLAWQEWTVMEDAVMIGLDPAATVVDGSGASGAFQVHQSSVETDLDGPRRVTMLLPPGLTAEMEFNDGSTAPLPSFTLRSTEYTVGATGEAAMPAPLPPASAYTWAAEFSADEAVQAGASHVRFDRPVVVHLDNFLEFPVGVAVPVGWYDRDAAVWRAEPDGWIVGIVSETAGLADLDVTGDGVADGSAELAPFGITEGERAELARLFDPGQSFWRVRISHMSPYDLNFPRVPEGDETKPKPEEQDDPPLEDPEQEDEERESETCEIDGSVIECQNQILGERIPITGTPFSLNYRSDRVAGWREGREIRIPVTTSNPPENLALVGLRIEVAGRAVATATLPPEPNLEYTFRWDGRDAHGRLVQGSAKAKVRIGYGYPATLGAPTVPDLTSFGEACLANDQECEAAPIPLERLRTLQYAFTQREMVLRGADDALTKLGRWTPGIIHSYDPLARMLYRGDGSRRSISDPIEGGLVRRRLAGTGQAGFSGDGGPATEADLRLAQGPSSVDHDGAGTLWIADEGNHGIRRVGPDGIIETVAGTGTAGFSGDGGPASAAQLSSPRVVVVAPTGELYIGDQGNFRVRMIDRSGTIRTVAGDGTSGSPVDGVAATSAPIGGEVRDLTLGADGSLYIIVKQGRASSLRRVGLDGRIRTLTDAGACPRGGRPEDGIRGVCPQAVVADVDGTLLVIGNGGFLFRVDPEGAIQPIVRGIIFTLRAEGAPERAAVQGDPVFGAVDVDVNLDGETLLVGFDALYRIKGLEAFTVAGGSGSSDAEDGSLARASRIPAPDGVAASPSGAFLIPSRGEAEVVGIQPQIPGVGFTQIVDGGALHRFSQQGVHLETVDATTGTLRYRFNYDPGTSYLESIEDAWGNITTIERDASGQPLAIVGPFGQRTELTVQDDLLTAVTNPAGETTRMTYHGTGGLLASFADPRGNASTFAYDDRGRVIQDTDAVGGVIGLDRTESADGYTVTRTTPEGRTVQYTVGSVPGGAERRENTDAAGLTTEPVKRPDGTKEVASPDGTTTSSRVGPDPRYGMQAPVVEQADIETGDVYQFMEGGRRVELADAFDPSSLLTQVDSVFINGREFRQTYSATTREMVSETPEGRTSVMRLGTRDELVEQTLPGVAAVNYVYDAQGRLSGLAQGGRSWQYSYDGAGRLATATDPLGRSTQFDYDQADRLTRQTLPDGREVGYAYDAAGNLTGVTPPGRPAHTFTYNGVNLATEYRPPSVDATDPATRYTYDLDRALTQVQRPDGIAVDFTYDAAGRASQVSFPGGLLEYGYDPSTGQLTGVNGPYGAALSMSYEGSLLTGMEWIGEVDGTVNAAYDDDFRVRELRVNGADPVSFGYDGDGLLTQAGGLSAGRDPASGRLTGTTLGSVTNAQDYNAFGELASLGWSHAGSPLLETTYTRDALGRIETKTETTGGVSTTWAYSYDVSGRLTEVQRGGVTVEAYTYDANGNRTSLTSSGGVITATYDAQDRLLTYGANTYTYMANGELTAKTRGSEVTTYDYDPLGNLLEVGLPDGTTVEYVVDGVGRRIGRKVDGTLEQGWLYQDGLNPIAELDGAGSVVARFVYGTRATVPDYMVKGGVTYRIVSDELGSVRLVVDVATGAVAQELQYDAWGRVLVDTNPGFQPFGYAGGLYDPLTGLVRFGARDYDAETGRWTAKDPIGFGGGDGNHYRYVGADPVNMVDPHGAFGLPGALLGVVIELGWQRWVEDRSWSCLDYGDLIAAAYGGAFLPGRFGSAWKILKKTRLLRIYTKWLRGVGSASVRRPAVAAVRELWSEVVEAIIDIPTAQAASSGLKKLMPELHTATQRRSCPCN